jgi:hypothetical protein
MTTDLGLWPQGVRLATADSEGRTGGTAIAPGAVPSLPKPQLPNPLGPPRFGDGRPTPGQPNPRPQPGPSPQPLPPTKS